MTRPGDRMHWQGTILQTLNAMANIIVCIPGKPEGKVLSDVAVTGVADATIAGSGLLIGGGILGTVTCVSGDSSFNASL